jgi:hypothetical protein
MKGEVVYLYAFDVANEINTSKVQELLSRKPFPFEIRLDRTLPRDVPLYRPLAVEPSMHVRLFRHPIRLLIRIYEVGVVSITVRVAVEVNSLAELWPFHNPVLDNGKSLDKVAREWCGEVCKGLAHSMVQSSPIPEPEAYTVFCLTDLGGSEEVPSWLAAQRQVVAGLLCETNPNRLSEAQVRDVLRVQFSFENTDLAIIDWDAALIVDLAGYVDDVLFVLELANLQLEEFRVMDQRLDEYLDRAYVDLDQRRRAWWGGLARFLRVLRKFRVDLARLSDEVTHITKFFGDWYLARVYLGARDRFHLDQWRQSVDNRLAQLDQLYNVVHSEANERRMLWLEVAIVVLFVLDLLALFFMK